MQRIFSSVAAGTVAALLLVSIPATEASAQVQHFYSTGGACDFTDIPGVVWFGPERYLTLEKLAASMAPILWFSPDEPLLDEAEGDAIRIPEALPFQDKPDGPVVYYQFDRVLVSSEHAESALQRSDDKAGSILDLEYTDAFDMHFYTYFRSEEGLAAHPHDLEQMQFKVVVLRTTDEYVKERTDAQCDEVNYLVIVTRVSAKAHGIIWFWNVIETDRETRFPMHILVEEGKHGLCTDKNGDGYFTPGYDVSRHINDAWGIRDNIRSGQLVSGGYQSWMTKVRRPEHRVYPPLPEDSPGRVRLARRGYYREPYVEYELRPLPPKKDAEYDPALLHFMEGKAIEGWPVVKTSNVADDVIDWVEEGSVVKSLAISAYTDGEWGLSFVFPFFIVKNLETSVSGGFLMWRLYLKDHGLRDFGAMVLYTPSASRWFDTYFAVGYERDKKDVMGEVQTFDDFILESGVKFRVQVGLSPFKFLTAITDFWGFRAGIKNYGFTDIERLTYIFELGAGAF